MTREQYIYTLALGAMIGWYLSITIRKYHNAYAIQMFDVIAEHDTQIIKNQDDIRNNKKTIGSLLNTNTARRLLKLEFRVDNALDEIRGIQRS